MTVDDANRHVEWVAQAIHDPQPEAFAWDAEPASAKEHFQEYARNAIRLLDEDIGVLILSLSEVTAGQTAPQAAGHRPQQRLQLRQGISGPTARVAS